MPLTQRRLRPAILVPVLAATLLAGGCQSYLDDSTMRTPGEATDDVSILTVVKARLVGDSEIRGLRINVDVSRAVVTLTGEVRSEAERKRAIEIAKEVPSVARVVDALIVRD